MWLVGSKPVRYKCYNSNIFFAWSFAQMTSCFVHYDVGGWQPYVSDELCGWYQLRKCKYPFLLSGLPAQHSNVFYFLWVERERGVSFKNVKMKPGKQEMIQPVRFALWLLVLRCFSQYFGRNRRNPSLRIQPPYIAHWRWKVTTQEINDAEEVVFAGYKESLRCALFILFHCIVLHFKYFISFHFLLLYFKVPTNWSSSWSVALAVFLPKRRSRVHLGSVS